LNRREKEQIISDLHQQVEKFRAVVLTNYRGLNVEQMSQLRQRLREEKVSFNVVKNTLMKLASKGTDLEKLNNYFEGPTAIAVSQGDPISLAKILSDFQKTQPLFEIKAGVIEGRVTPPAEVKAMASMPSREAILAQILGEVQTPGTQLAGVLYGAVQQVVNIIQARVDQLVESESGK
jgi:large subunit ribosomal protein L10